MLCVLRSDFLKPEWIQLRLIVPNVDGDGCFDYRIVLPDENECSVSAAIDDEFIKSKGLLENGPLCTFVSPVLNEDGYGSTDVGDVMHIVPCVQLMTATCNLAAPGHSWQITACSGMSIGMKGMLYGSKVMAATAMKLVEEPELIAKAKEEFAKQMNGRTYKCPIPKEIPVPQPQV